MLTIGDFSRLSRVSPRMLRYYDALGLLRPETVGENGYRYYRQEQLSDLLEIQWLKSCGFPLGEISALRALDKPQLARRLRQQCQLLRQELAARQEQLHRLEQDILQMEGRQVMENQYPVVVMKDPAQKVFSIRKTLGVEEYHALFAQLRQEARRRGLTQAGPIQMLYYNQDFDPERSDVEAQMVVDQDGPGVTVKPAFTCAAVKHRGPYENLHLAYNALCAWLAQHPEYQVCGPAMDRYFNDPHQLGDPQLLETGVLFPIEKVK